MTPENRAKDFATWLILHTKETSTLGAYRIYKNNLLKVDELYDAWVEFKQETKTKF